MSKVYDLGIIAYSGLSYRDELQQALTKVQATIDDFYEAAEKLGYYCFHATGKKNDTTSNTRKASGGHKTLTPNRKPWPILSNC